MYVYRNTELTSELSVSPLWALNPILQALAVMLAVFLCDTGCALSPSESYITAFQIRAPHLTPT